jgi:hypothetical protein
MLMPIFIGMTREWNALRRKKISLRANIPERPCERGELVSEAVGQLKPGRCGVSPLERVVEDPAEPGLQSGGDFPLCNRVQFFCKIFEQGMPKSPA